MIAVVIWREEDLSGQFPVDETGAVTLPMLGRREVTGVPWQMVRDSLLSEYQAQLRNPSIQLTPLRRVNVLGEVYRPGLYELDPTVSLAGVIAMAGGATPSGDLNKIRVIRDGRVIRERVAAGASLNSADVRSGDQIFVEQRSWFVRNSTFVISLLFSATSIVITLVR
jgi:polysaccharide export outer membrane protein